MSLLLLKVLYILIKLRKTRKENSRMLNFIFSDSDCGRKLKNDSVLNFSELIYL